MLRRQPCCASRRFGRTVVTFLLISHKPQRWSWNWRYRQKAHELSFPKMCLPNGNVVTFLHTNRKHFAVGGPMAFPRVKMGSNPPKNLPFPLDNIDFHLIQQCLGPPHAPLQTAVPTVEALSHADAVKSSLFTMALHKSAQKYLFPWTDHQTPLPVSSLNPFELWCHTASGSDPPFFHNALDRPIDRPTDRPTDRRSRESLTTIGRCASRATRPKNKTPQNRNIY